MKLYSLNIIINDVLINKSSPILYRMEDNDIYSTQEICQNKVIINLISNAIDDIFDLTEKTYISFIYYDTDTDTYTTDKLYIDDIIKNTNIENDVINKYLHNLSLILYKKTTNKKWKEETILYDITNIKKELMNLFNISNDTYNNCIMSMINEDIENSKDTQIQKVLTNIKDNYNKILKV